MKQTLLLPNGNAVLFSEITAVSALHHDEVPGVTIHCRAQGWHPPSGLYQRAKDNKEADGIRDDFVEKWTAWLEAQAEEPTS